MTKSLGQVGYTEYCKQYGFEAHWDALDPTAKSKWEVIAYKILEECGNHD